MGLPFDIAEREIACVRKSFEHVTEVVSGFDQLGVPAEKLARRAVGRMAGYLESSAFAGPYLADQLLLPFALAGRGAFTTVRPSQHSLTTAAVIERFLDRRCVFTQLPGGSHRMEAP